MCYRAVSGAVRLICPECKRRFLAVPSAVLRGSKYCSRACYAVARHTGRFHIQDDRPRCRHCGLRGINRPRSLCHVCYLDQKTRDLYEPETRTYIHPRRIIPLAAEATSYAPGTEGKVAVLEERAAARVQLFHPLDRGL